MKYTVILPTKILKKLKKHDKTTKERILKIIEEISEEPEKFKPLRYELRGNLQRRLHTNYPLLLFRSRHYAEWFRGIS